jgi:hypothetical protein
MRNLPLVWLFYSARSGAAATGRFRGEDCAAPIIPTTALKRGLKTHRLPEASLAKVQRDAAFARPLLDRVAT